MADVKTEVQLCRLRSALKLAKRTLAAIAEEVGNEMAAQTLVYIEEILSGNYAGHTHKEKEDG